MAPAGPPPSTPSPRAPASPGRPSPTCCATPTGSPPPPASGSCAAIRETGYRPSLPARQLATRRAHAIAVRAERQQDGISGLVLDAFYHGLAEAGQDNGLRVLLYAQPADEAAEVAAHRRARPHRRRRRRRAHRDQRGRRAPRPPARQRHDVLRLRSAVGPRRRAARLGRRRRRGRHRRSPYAHLLDRGRRRIAYLGWPGDGADPSTGTDRRRGWLEALGDAGLDGAPVEAAQPQRRRRGRGRRRPSCSAGADAPGRDRVRERHPRPRRAPRGPGRRRAARPATVVGFDATPVAAALGLASVAQPIDQVAHLCIDLLTGRFEQPDRPARGAAGPTRRSTSPPDRPDPAIPRHHHKESPR